MNRSGRKGLSKWLQNLRFSGEVSGEAEQKGPPQKLSWFYAIVARADNGVVQTDPTNRYVFLFLSIPPNGRKMFTTIPEDNIPEKGKTKPTHDAG